METVDQLLKTMKDYFSYDFGLTFQIKRSMT